MRALKAEERKISLSMPPAADISIDKNRIRENDFKRCFFQK